MDVQMTWKPKKRFIGCNKKHTHTHIHTHIHTHTHTHIYGGVINIDLVVCFDRFKQLIIAGRIYADHVDGAPSGAGAEEDGRSPGGVDGVDEVVQLPAAPAGGSARPFWGVPFLRLGRYLRFQRRRSWRWRPVETDVSGRIGRIGRVDRIAR